MPLTFKRAKWGTPLAVFLVAAGCGAASTPIAPPTAILITNSGSTNTIGYRVLIGSDGTATFSSGTGSGDVLLPSALFDRLKSDIDAAAPLSHLPVAACAKSASLGSSTFIARGDDRSPDLSCPAQGQQAQALEQDVAAVVAFLKLRNVPRGQGKALPPL